MSHNTPFDVKFYLLLMAIDDDLKEKIRSKGCPCGGPLNTADYPRSPLGLKPDERKYFEQRNGLCCGQCRRRIKVPTVRFMGRIRYPGFIFVMFSLLTSKSTIRTLNKIQKYFGLNIDLRTWRRWRKWWGTTFEESKFWRHRKSIVPTVKEQTLPRALIYFYKGNFRERLLHILIFLAPMTAGIYHAV